MTSFRRGRVEHFLFSALAALHGKIEMLESWAPGADQHGPGHNAEIQALQESQTSHPLPHICTKSSVRLVLRQMAVNPK